MHPARAFTLAEVMMAAFVLALGLVGMIQVITSGSEMLDTSRKQAIAIRIIQSQIDQYRGSIPADWSQVSNSTSTITLSSTPFSAVATGFTCTRTISSAIGDGTIKKVTYTVTWTGNTGRSHTRTGSTYIGKHGLHVSYQRF
jgi:Tfp pilus assembly protein PilV